MPSADGTINACYVKPGYANPGKLRVVDTEAGQSCNSREAPLAWNQQGPPGVSGHEMVIASSAANSVDVKAAPVYCPTGKRVLGGGAKTYSAYNINSAMEEVAIGTSNPSPSGNGWYAVAYEVLPTSDSWALTAYAVCANVE